MLPLQDARDLDYGVQELDIITSGFTPWGADTCPSLEQLMAATADAPSSEGPSRTAEEEERRQRRKTSNRESARRSRARKQKMLEELRATAARLQAENRELAARLHAVEQHGLAARSHNARLRTEAAELARRLHEARRLLALQRLAQLLPPPPGGYGAGGACAPAAPIGLASLMT